MNNKSIQVIDMKNLPLYGILTKTLNDMNFFIPVLATKNICNCKYKFINTKSR